jgi:hypothetical protein
MADPTPPRWLPARGHRAGVGVYTASLADNVRTRRVLHSLPRHRMHTQTHLDLVSPRSHVHHIRRDAWGCRARCWRWCCCSRSRRRQRSERRWAREPGCHPVAPLPQTAARRSARHAFPPAAAGGQRMALRCGNLRETPLAHARRGGQTCAASARLNMRAEAGKRSTRCSRPLMSR